MSPHAQHTAGAAVAGDLDPHAPADSLNVAAIFRAHGEAFRRAHTLSDEQRHAMWSIEHCRTRTLGGHRYQCATCATEVPLYNSCLSRFCPTCQGPAQYKWIAARQQRLLPTHYFHVVFTLPAPLRPLATRSPQLIFDILFAAAAHTLLDLGRDPALLGAEMGITLVLHTWTRELTFHPHVHGIVPGGGLDTAADRWVACDPRYLFNVKKILSPVFRGKFLEALIAAYQRGAFTDDHTLDDHTFRQLITRLQSQSWVVYAKPPFDGPPQIVNYLGRYTHRTGISNGRLVSISDDAVPFRTTHGNTCTLPPPEFIRRFLLHILPHGYTKIRHYGLLAAGNVNTKLVRARELLEKNHPPPSPPATTASDCHGAEAPGDGAPADPAKPKLRCPNCAGTLFILLGPLPPTRRRRNHPPPHT